MLNAKYAVAFPSVGLIQQWVTQTLQNVLSPDYTANLIPQLPQNYTPEKLAPIIQSAMQAGASGAAILGMAPADFAQLQQLVRKLEGGATFPLTDMFYTPLSVTRFVARRFTYYVDTAQAGAAMHIVAQLGFQPQLATYGTAPYTIEKSLALDANADTVLANILPDIENAVNLARAECIALLGPSGTFDPTLAPMLRKALSGYEYGTPVIIDPVASAITYLQSHIANKLWINRTMSAAA